MRKLLDSAIILSLGTAFLYCVGTAHSHGFLLTLGLDSNLLEKSTRSTIYSGMIHSLPSLFTIFLFGLMFAALSILLVDIFKKRILKAIVDHKFKVQERSQKYNIDSVFFYLFKLSKYTGIPHFPRILFWTFPDFQGAKFEILLVLWVGFRTAIGRRLPLKLSFRFYLNIDRLLPYPPSQSNRKFFYSPDSSTLT